VKKLWLTCFAVTLWAQQPESSQALMTGKDLLDSYQRVIRSWSRPPCRSPSSLARALR